MHIKVKEVTNQTEMFMILKSGNMLVYGQNTNFE